MREPNYQKMIELLAFVLHCPVCSNKYTAERTLIIETKDKEPHEHSSMLVHADCDKCKSSVVFSISLDGPEVFSVGMVTDLTAADTIRFRDRSSITFDEVMDFHDFLEKFDGNFERILR